MTNPHWKSYDTAHLRDELAFIERKIALFPLIGGDDVWWCELENTKRSLQIEIAERDRMGSKP